MFYTLDTEFNEFGGQLISLALTSGNRELYLATDCPNPGNWVKQNVLPILACEGAIPEMVSPEMFGPLIANFLSQDKEPTIIADWPDDISYFCKALIVGPGQMVNIPQLDFMIRRVDSYPSDLPAAIQHNALWDARALQYKLLKGS